MSRLRHQRRQQQLIHKPLHTNLLHEYFAFNCRMFMKEMKRTNLKYVTVMYTSMFFIILLAPPCMSLGIIHCHDLNVNLNSSSPNPLKCNQHPGTCVTKKRRILSRVKEDRWLADRCLGVDMSQYMVL